MWSKRVQKWDGQYPRTKRLSLLRGRFFPRHIYLRTCQGFHFTCTYTTMVAMLWNLKLNGSRNSHKRFSGTKQKQSITAVGTQSPCHQKDSPPRCNQSRLQGVLPRHHVINAIWTTRVFPLQDEIWIKAITQRNNDNLTSVVFLFQGI